MGFRPKEIVGPGLTGLAGALPALPFPEHWEGGVAAQPAVRIRKTVNEPPNPNASFS